MCECQPCKFSPVVKAWFLTTASHCHGSTVTGHYPLYAMNSLNILIVLLSAGKKVKGNLLP